MQSNKELAEKIIEKARKLLSAEINVPKIKGTVNFDTFLLPGIEQALNEAEHRGAMKVYDAVKHRWDDLDNPEICQSLVEEALHATRQSAQGLEGKGI